MKNRTRYFSLLLALVMCLNLFPGGWALESVPGDEPVSAQTEIVSTRGADETGNGQERAETPEVTESPAPAETPEPEPTETPEPIPTQVPAQNFVIQDGVLTRYTGPSGDVVIPNGVTSIGKSAFSSCKSLTSVIIPDSVTVIGDSAFDNCTGLTYVSFGSGVTTIGSGAFWNCHSLTELTLPDSLVTISSLAFNFCSGLTSVTIPGGVTTIGPSAFKECSNLTDVVIPDSVTTLGESAFYCCTKLASATIGDGVTVIGGSTFESCTSLTDVTIGSGVTTLDDKVFCGCTNLAHITIPNNVTDLGIMAFWNCSNLTDVDIGTGVTMIRGSTFGECTSLTHIRIPASVTEIDSAAFENCTALASVTIDSADTKVNGYAFNNCTSLTSYTQAGKMVELGKNGLSKEESYKGSTSLTKEEQAEKSRQEAIQRSQGSLVYAERLAANQEFLEHITERDYIYTIVTEDVQALSDKLCEGLTTDREKVYALHEWVTENIYYDYPSLAGVHPAVTAQYVLDRKTYVCSGYTVLMQALCWAQKIPCVYIQGPTTNGFHAWNAVEIDGEWLWLDATWDTFNEYYGGDRWVEGNTRLDYFLCSDEFISTDHKASYTIHSHREDGVLVSQYVTWCYTANGINADLPDQTAEETREIIQQGNKDLENEKPLEEQLQQKALEDPTLSDWAEEEVSEAISKSLVPSDLQSGYTSAITRLDFCRLMVTLVEQVSGKNINTYLSDKGLTVTKPFTDTTNDQVLAAYALGIVKGTSETTFNPSGSITRQEAATMLARTAKLLGLTAGASETFRDITQIADWAKDGVFFVSALKDPTTGNKVMGGTGDGNFSPLGTYTREQAILTALRLFHCE